MVYYIQTSPFIWLMTIYKKIKPPNKYTYMNGGLTMCKS